MSRPQRRFGLPTLLLALALAMPSGAGTAAAYTDSAPATSGTITAATLPSPAALPPASTCTANNGLFSSSMTINWGGVAPTAGSPPLSAYEYQLEFLDRNNANRILNTATVTHTGGSGAQQSYVVTSGTFANLLGLNWLSLNRITTQVRSHLVGTSWRGATAIPVNWTTSTLFGVTSFNCLQ
ncbi:hypothetical protein [Curtobacterium sp. UNCCL17]|uniref:hypothetical protein n=1 Tax=Curtobacterium sp. UNCCL17 TaxID=1449051 RepID=UPI0004848703|nr:hypothetical protein [Curtobacterium sp. UNCCL17]